MENLNELIRSEYADYLRERLIVERLEVHSSKPKVELPYDVIEPIGNDMYRFRQSVHDKNWGIVNSNGEIILAQENYQIEEFKNGYAVISRDMCHFNAIDASGKLYFADDLYINTGLKDLKALTFYKDYYSYNGILFDYNENAVLEPEDTFGAAIIQLGDGIFCSANDIGVLYNDRLSMGKILFPDGKVKKISNVVATSKSRYISGIIDLEDGALDHNFQFIRRFNGNDYIRYQRTLRGYKYYSPNENKEYLLKHKPILDVGDYILCCNAAYTFMYNKKLDMYEMLFNEPINDDFTYENGVFSCPKYKLKFYFLGDSIIDIKYLNDDEIVSGKKYDGYILSFSEFEEKVMEDEFVAQRLKEKTMANQVTLEHANATILQTEVDNRRQNILNAIEVLQNELVNLENYSTVQKRSIISTDVLLEQKDDHLVIKPIFINLLSYFDLGQVDFKNVDVKGLDLSYTKANINPQEVYNKDMSNGIYKNINFIAFDFTGVNLRGADLSECNLDFAILDGAFIDEKTVLPNTNTLKK